MRFDGGTIKHLGVQMYSSLPPVIGELVSNAWDAGATEVFIILPKDTVNETSIITVQDDGSGMTSIEVQSKFLVVGRDRRKEENDARVVVDGIDRPVMGRKGIGKFSGFGIAREIEIETVKDGDASRFIMSYKDLEAKSKDGKIKFPKLPSTGTLAKGTFVTLRDVQKFKTRKINIPDLRRGLARQYAVIGVQYNFRVFVNGEEITTDERDLKQYLDKDKENNSIVREYNDIEIQPSSGWHVSGWIGAITRDAAESKAIKPGVIVMARGKMVQSPFFFNIDSSHPNGFSYLVGEIHAEFVDTFSEDTVATSRTTLVWDTEANSALQKWGSTQLYAVARDWATKRGEANLARVENSSVYQSFLEDTKDYEFKRHFKAANNLIRSVVLKNPERDTAELQPLVEMASNFVKFDSFVELAERMTEASAENVPELIALFSEWELIEAREMLNVTKGRLQTIEKLGQHIAENALEVPTLHNFLKNFPWVIDPRWTLISDETRYSQLLRDEFPEDIGLLESDRRIDFLCVGESDTLIVVEIKRPLSKASKNEFDQIETYVNWMRDHVSRSSSNNYTRVVGYLLVGDVVSTGIARQKIDNLRRSDIYIRRYAELLDQVRGFHNVFLERYEDLRRTKNRHEVVLNAVSDLTVPESDPN